MSSSPPRVDGWPSQPVILEINTWVWLDELSRRHGRRVDLATLGGHDWEDVLLPGLDAVWLMGVWQRSPLGAGIARTDPGVREDLQAALPDLTDDDIVGSPYCVRSYTVDERLGGDDGLAAARVSLARRGIRLLVDYVPNHVARDHDWVRQCPDHLIHGSAADLEQRPDRFFTVGDRVVALARDPYFPPWTDVAQLNAFSPALRTATTRTLDAIAARADGVRCDMAMLLLNDVFARTWEELAGSRPQEDFWPDIIQDVRARHPSFLFIAEAYWGLEATLLEHGFDHCYDKALYDRLITRDAQGVRDHLTADIGVQRRTVRFLENHDEPRSAVRLPQQARMAAAVAVTTVPGALLLYEGQADGRRERPPVQLGRRPDEPVDTALRMLYEGLLARIQRLRMRDGDWLLQPTDGAVLAWLWVRDDAVVAVAVNLGDAPAEARVGGLEVALGAWEFCLTTLPGGQD